MYHYVSTYMQSHLIDSTDPAFVNADSPNSLQGCCSKALSHVEQLGEASARLPMARAANHGTRHVGSSINGDTLKWMVYEGKS